MFLTIRLAGVVTPGGCSIGYVDHTGRHQLNIEPCLDCCSTAFSASFRSWINSKYQKLGATTDTRIANASEKVGIHLNPTSGALSIGVGGHDSTDLVSNSAWNGGGAVQLACSLTHELETAWFQPSRL